MNEQSTTTLFSSPAEVDHAIQAAELAEVTIEVFPSETDTDRTVAAEAFALSAELSGNPTIDPDQPENKGDTGFWQAYSHLRSRR